MLRDHQLSLGRKPRVQGEKAHGHDQEFWDWNLQSLWSNNPWVVGFEGKYAKLLLNILSQNPLKIKQDKQASKHLGFTSCTVYLSCLFMFHDRSRLPPGHYSTIPRSWCRSFPLDSRRVLLQVPDAACSDCSVQRKIAIDSSWLTTQTTPHQYGFCNQYNHYIYNINMYTYIYIHIL